MTLKLYVLIEDWTGNILMEKSCRKCTKIVPDALFILVNNPKQPLYARISFENKIFWKRMIKKFLKD